MKIHLNRHRDNERNKLVHDAKKVRTESLRLLIGLGTILSLDISIADWKQGNVHSKSALLRKVFMKPREIQLSRDELVQVLRPVNGLPDSGEY